MNSIEKAKAALEDSNSILAAIGGEGWAQAQGQILDNNEAIAALASLPTGEPVAFFKRWNKGGSDERVGIQWNIPDCDIPDEGKLYAAPVSQDDKRDAERLDWLEKNGLIPSCDGQQVMSAHRKNIDRAMAIGVDAAIREGK